MIALVNPPFSKKNTEYFTFNRCKYASLSLAYIAGYLEKRGVAVNVIDAKFNNYSFDEIVRLLKKSEAHIIGLTSNTSEINHTNSLIHFIREKLPRSFIILGGVHACALPEETLAGNSDLNALAFTEGENILHQLACAKDARAALPQIEGLLYRNNGKIVRNKKPRLPISLKAYGSAAFHHWPQAEGFHVITYRSCPFPCSFCFNALGKRPRLRDISEVMADIEYIAQFSPRKKFNISDPTFGLHREHTKELLDEIIRRGLHRRFKWNCTTRVDIITDDLLDHMLEAGCDTVAFGIESGSERVLRLTGKNTNIQQIRHSVKRAKQNGLRTTGYNIFGHIGETKSDLQKTIKAIWKINTDEINIGIMVPWPGTKVYQLAKCHQGGYKLLEEDFGKFDKYFGEVMQFDNFSPRYLEIMRIIAYLKLYLYNFRVKDLMGFLIANQREAWKKMSQILTRLH